MRYVIDFKNKIVDFYIEDDAGKENHSGLAFGDVKALFYELVGRINVANIIEYINSRIETLEADRNTMLDIPACEDPRPLTDIITDDRIEDLKHIARLLVGK